MNQNLLPLFIGLTGSWFAQFLKIFYYKIKTGKWNPWIFFTSGMMPSSHTAGFAALSTALYFVEGITTTFSLSVAVLIVVTYDAANVRWYGGVASQKIDYLSKELLSKNIIEAHTVLEKKLKLILGHKASEVVVGILVGTIYALITTKLFI